MGALKLFGDPLSSKLLSGVSMRLPGVDPRPAKADLFDVGVDITVVVDGACFAVSSEVSTPSPITLMRPTAPESLVIFAASKVSRYLTTAS